MQAGLRHVRGYFASVSSKFRIQKGKKGRIAAVPNQSLPRFVKAAALVTALLLPQQAISQHGFADYLTARMADLNQEFAEAAHYYVRSIEADPGNQHILQSAIWPLTRAGEFERAIEVAQSLEDGDLSQGPAAIVLFADDLANERYESASDRLLDFTDPDSSIYAIVPGWLELAKGDVGAAVAAFDSLSDEDPFKPYAQFHKALAMGMAGDFEGAGEIMTALGTYPDEILNQARLAQAQVLSQLEDNDGAIDVLPIVRRARSDPSIEMIGIARERLANGEQIDFDIITAPEHGIAELFAMLGRYFRSEGDVLEAVNFGRVASMMDPDNVVLQLAVANLLQDAGNADLAREIFGQVPPDHGLFPTAAISNAGATYDVGEPDQAIELLETLSDTHGQYPWVYAELGDLHRYESNFEESVAAYDTALAKMDELNRIDWTVQYFRGVSNFELDRWEDARADFEKAVELSNGNAHVLNYLGYSLADRGEELDYAEDLIRKAVEQIPDSGAFVDSLGWVFYRKGRFDEAVEQLELAAKLLPYDPIVTDHLGDAYWKVGRTREAYFLWNRALSFDPAEADEERILRKIELGLEAVLEEEQADSGSQGSN